MKKTDVLKELQKIRKLVTEFYTASFWNPVIKKELDFFLGSITTLEENIDEDLKKDLMSKNITIKDDKK